MDVEHTTTSANATNRDIAGRDEGFAFQAGAGLKYAVNDQIDIDLGYRYRGVLDLSHSTGTRTQVFHYNEDDFSSHSVQFGLTYKLGNRTMESLK